MEYPHYSNAVPNTSHMQRKYFLAQQDMLPAILQGSETLKTTIRIRNAGTDVVKGVFVEREPDSDLVKG